MCFCKQTRDYAQMYLSPLIQTGGGVHLWGLDVFARDSDYGFYRYVCFSAKIYVYSIKCMI